MAAKIAAFLVTLVLTTAAGVVILFMMLIAMNGYSEGDATWGLGGYVILAMAATSGMSIGAVLAVKLLIRRQFSPLTSVLIAAPVFVIVGVGLDIICSFIGVGIAEFVRIRN